MRSRWLRAWPVAVAIGALVAGCALPVPAVHPDPKPADPPPVVQKEQIKRVETALTETLTASTEAGSVAGLATRVDGAALSMRQAEFAVHAADPESELTEFQTVFRDDAIVEASSTWPRSFVTVTVPGNQVFPMIYLMTQSDARSPYKLMAWSTMLPQAVLPKVADSALGSKTLAADAEGLLMPPATALDTYAKAKDNPA
ncbi:MAG: hypothetical protein LBR19_00495, partial [Bifidobacteriaceae bacterium]|nr:hypothetical protein [Bifidobacteriaceae bacterium]